MVLGPDGLSRFEDLRGREAPHKAILTRSTSSSMVVRIFAISRFLAALARLLRGVDSGILLNEHIAEDGPIVFAHACRLGAEGIVSKKVDGTYRSGPCPVRIKVRNPASIAVQQERSEKDAIEVRTCYRVTAVLDDGSEPPLVLFKETDEPHESPCQPNIADGESTVQPALPLRGVFRDRNPVSNDD